MTLITLPDIPTGFTASISDSLADAGMLAVVVAVLALPAIFWIIHRLQTLFPQPGKVEERKGSQESLDRGLMKHYYRRRYLEHTDDRSERGDFLIRGE